MPTEPHPTAKLDMPPAVTLAFIGNVLLVTLAVVALVADGLAFYSPWFWLGCFVLPAGFLWGLLTRSQLCWWLSRVGYAASAIAMAVSLIYLVTEGPSQAGLLLPALKVGVPALMFHGFGRPASRRYFGLTCHDCDVPAGTGAVLFWHQHCTDCGNLVARTRPTGVTGRARVC